MSQFIEYGLRFLFVLPAIVLHEIAHGYAAYLLGDTTAKDRGRLSLNPVRHIDPFGTLLLPAILLAMSGGRAAFGYAKPVPINPYRFKDYRWGMLITGLAGPAVNLVLAAVSGFAARLATTQLWWDVAFGFSLVNLTLLFFNLIPFPPLDGSRILPVFLTDNGMRVYAKVEQYGFLILLGVLWIVPAVFRIDPIGIYLSVTVEPLLRLFTGL